MLLPNLPSEHPIHAEYAYTGAQFELLKLAPVIVVGLFGLYSALSIGTHACAAVYTADGAFVEAGVDVG